MAADPLDQVLRLVAEGKLTAEEAAPILAALDEAPGTAAPGPAAGPGSAPGPDAGSAGGWTAGTATTLRLEVRESGRQVVNLRLPLAVGRYALDRVPGLSGEQVDSVRQALSQGMRGQLLTVDDGDNSVRIVLE